MFVEMYITQIKRNIILRYTALCTVLCCVRCSVVVSVKTEFLPAENAG